MKTQPDTPAMLEASTAVTRPGYTGWRWAARVPPDLNGGAK